MSRFDPGKQSKARKSWVDSCQQSSSVHEGGREGGRVRGRVRGREEGRVRGREGGVEKRSVRKEERKESQLGREQRRKGRHVLSSLARSRSYSISSSLSPSHLMCSSLHAVFNFCSSSFLPHQNVAPTCSGPLCCFSRTLRLLPRQDVFSSVAVYLPEIDEITLRLRLSPSVLPA
eukprot:1322250-Rhodomonas_salina.2